MLVLGVETSCDDTAAALLQDGKTILANVVSSQDNVHGPYGGVVPELASRQHIQNILPIVDAALKNAGATLANIDGFAVTYGPGLVGSLLVGMSLVKGMSFRSGIPFVGVNHLEAHLLAIHLEMTWPSRTSRCSPPAAIRADYVKDVGRYIHSAAPRRRRRRSLRQGGENDGAGLSRRPDHRHWQKPAIPRRCASRARDSRTAPMSLVLAASKPRRGIISKSRGRKWQPRQADIAASFQEAVVDMLVNPTIRAAAADGGRASSCRAGLPPIAGCAQR